jgi:DNA (cytosine-5)-methyltransferase 1
MEIKIFGNKNPKDEGEPMFTLTAQDRHGVAISDLPLAYDEQNSTLRKDGTVGTLTTDGSSPKHNNRVIVGNNQVRIRRLTPREVWRLQGFPDEYFDKAAAVISDTQLYKAAGNAVTVNVARAIGLKLKEIENEET